MNALLKKRYFQKKVIRESCAIYAYECSPGLSVLTKWPVFLQYAFGKPNVNQTNLNRKLGKKLGGPKEGSSKNLGGHSPSRPPLRIATG